MSKQWQTRDESDNRGKPFTVWFWADYELAENVNLGAEGGWVFELLYRGRFLALAATLAKGKEAAAEHHASQAEAERANEDGALEVAS